MIHSVAINSFLAKTLGGIIFYYFIVTLSSLIYYLVKIKFHKNERYPKQFFNLIIEQHQFLLNCFIRFKRLELLKDLGIGVGIGVLENFHELTKDIDGKILLIVCGV